MAVYGVDIFGLGRFGRDPTLIRPDFSVSPFTAMAIDYATLHLTWTKPHSTDCTYLRLVRSPRNLAQDAGPPPGQEIDQTQIDYAVVFTHPVEAISNYTDSNLGGGFYYYTMWGWSTNDSLWIRCTDLIALVPLNWGYGYKLYSLLPMAYRDQDLVLVDPYNPWPVNNPQPPLQRFLNLLGFQMDFIRTELESLMSANDPQNCSGALLPLLAHQMGLPNEPEMGMQQERQLIQNAVHLYKKKGSPGGIGEFCSILTGYAATVPSHHGYNVLLCRDDSIGETSIGTWQPWPPPYTHFPSPGGDVGLSLDSNPNMLTGPTAVSGMTNPLNTYPSNFPSNLEPPYNSSGIKVRGTGDLWITTARIPITDFMSSSYGPGHATFQIQIWSPTARQVKLSLWGDAGTGTPVPIIAETQFTETQGQWVLMNISGPINPYSNGLNNPAQFYWVFPVIHILGAGTEAHYLTLMGLWPCTPGQIGVDTSAYGYDYPRDVKTVLQPQAANLLSNPCTTFTRIDPTTDDIVQIGFDGLSASADPKTLDVLSAENSSFEGGTVGNWTVGANCTLTNQTTFAQVGTHSLRLVATGSGNMSANLTVPIPNLSAGQNFTAAASFRPGTTVRQVSLAVQWYDATSTLISTFTGNSTEVTGGWVSPAASDIVPVGANSAVVQVSVINAAPGEAHYVDNIVFAANLTCDLDIHYVDVEDPASLYAFYGDASLQVTASAPNATVWWGLVNAWDPAPPSPMGWFSDPSSDWFGGSSSGPLQARNWIDPTNGWFTMNNNYFSIATPVGSGGGNWFPNPPQPIQYGNLVQYTITGSQPLNFSVYARYATVMASTNAQMDIGFRWYYPDGSWQEVFTTVYLTDTWQRYSIPTLDINTNAMGLPPSEPLVGAMPNGVYPFVRFPAAVNAQFLINAAMLSPGQTLMPYTDATLTYGSVDFTQDSHGASYYYRRLAPRSTRLSAEIYRWIPMGASHTEIYSAGSTQPPLDPTLWP